MLAEAVSGSHEAFVDYMNGMAGRLGMTRTKFANANGLPDPIQVTTARDIAKLAAAVVRDFPQHAYMWSMLQMRVGKRQLHTHNGLLTNYAGADGMKTGFICDSGFNVVASATREGHKLVAVVLGEATGQERSVRAVNLLEHGFRTRRWKSLFGSSTLDTLPLDENAKMAVTKPGRVISAVCGTGGRAVARVKKKGRGIAGESQAKVRHARSKGRGTAMTRKSPSASP
jgi:D-alanyl-D-alanine carboxypeptidase